MEFLLLIIIAGFAIVGLVKATRHRRASGRRAFETTGRLQTPDSEPTFYGGSHHHGSSGHDSPSGDSSSDGGGGDGGGGGD